MAVFRIVHISDLHLATEPHWENDLEAIDILSPKAAAACAVSFFLHNPARKAFLPSTFDPDIAVSLARKIQKEFSDCDAILLTGDVATTGLDADIFVAKDFLLGNLDAPWSPLGNTPSLSDIAPTIILPG